jgi:putative ABC transport system permease protein
MFFYYLKFAKLTLVKNKYYAMLNALGLVCGMFATLVIAKYVGASLQLDNFHEKRDRIFTVTQEEFVSNNSQQRSELTYWGVGEIATQYPEVECVTRCGYHVESLVMTESINNTRISHIEGNILTTDSNFLKVFSFSTIRGDLSTALSSYNSIVITRAIAQKYFQSVDCLGKILTIRVPWGEERNYQVAAVVDDVPRNSRFSAQFLVSSPPPETEFTWSSPDYATYVLLKRTIIADEFSKRLTAAVNKSTELTSTSRSEKLTLVSLADVKLTNSEYLLIAIAIFIIAVSWINYINQVMAQSYWRIKQVGVLRVMGASRWNLRLQFIVESALVCVMAFALIFIAYFLGERHLQYFTNDHLLPLIGDPTYINYIFAGIFVLGLVITAVAPATVIFSRNFGATLRASSWNKVGKLGFRKGLVIAQFSISMVLIVSIFVISDQLTYLKRKSKGVNLENVLVLKAPILPDAGWIAGKKALALLKERCAKLPYVLQVTSSTAVPSDDYRRETYINVEGQRHKFLVHQVGVDEYYLDLYDVKFIAGQNFIPDAKAINKTGIILNESAARGLGFHDYQEALKTKIIDQETGTAYNLLGVVSDFHQTSLKNKIQPMAFKFEVLRGHVSLKVSGLASDNNGALAERITSIKNIWEEVYPDAAFDIFMLNQKFDMQDREDQSFAQLFKYFTILSIVISCSGLFGLSLLLSEKRQKEIGIRRVFGASTSNILTIILMSYAKPLLLSILVGCPVAYFLMDQWLQAYAYRTEIGTGVFVSSVTTLIVIFLCTVAYQSLKSSKVNPTRVLKADA